MRGPYCPCLGQARLQVSGPSSDCMVDFWTVLCLTEVIIGLASPPLIIPDRRSSPPAILIPLFHLLVCKFGGLWRIIVADGVLNLRVGDIVATWPFAI